MNRIYVFPWDQLSEGATAVAAALDTQKLLRKGSRYKPQLGDVIVNWGASDMTDWLRGRVEIRGGMADVTVLNQDVSVTIDKRVFFDRCEGMYGVPKSLTFKKGPQRLNMAKSMIAGGALTYPVLCRVKVKGKDGEGIVIAKTEAELVDAPLYVQLEEKTAEYRVHVGRNPDGSTSIIGVQQKFLPKGTKKEDCVLRTTSAGCYFVWTKDGKPVVLPESAATAVMAVFDRFPELSFGGFDVIYDLARNRAFVVEINSAPEMTEKSAELYAAFFNQFRELPKAHQQMLNDGFEYLGVQAELPPCGGPPGIRHIADHIFPDDPAELIAANNAAIAAAYDKWVATTGYIVPPAPDAWAAGWQAALNASMEVELRA